MIGSQLCCTSRPRTRGVMTSVDEVRSARRPISNIKKRCGAMPAAISAIALFALALLNELKAETGMGLILITHDLGVVAEVADDVVVMYAGREVERGPSLPVFHEPAHPYTVGLMQSLPRSDVHTERLLPIKGSPPDLMHIPTGCAFHPRCPYAQEICRTTTPGLEALGADRIAACHFAEEVSRG